MNRYEQNMAIMRVLERYFKDNPDQRFGQALVNLDVVTYVDDGGGGPLLASDPFYEESVLTLARVMDAYYGI